MRRLIIGLGSGRCGTLSLATLLSLQENTSVTHENCPVPWEFDEHAWEWITTKKLLSGNKPYNTEAIGDVGYYWINHIDRLLDLKSNTKFICLKRDRQEVIESMWKFTSGLNVHPTDDWYRMYPRYDAHPRDAVGLMWDDYYKIAERWQKKYPDAFLIMDMDVALNTEDGMGGMFEFLGITNPIMETNIQLNTS